MTAPARWLPTNERVAVAWLSSIEALQAGVSTSLPSDVNSWAEHGFVQVQMSGGGVNIYAPIRGPVVQVDCWATTLNSNKPPWGKANQLAEVILEETQGRDVARTVDLGEKYGPARVMSAYLVGEIMRIPSDEAGNARFMFDMAINWVRV